MSDYDKRYPNYDKNVKTPFFEVLIEGVDINQNNITDVDINWTCTGANNFKVSILDPNMELISSAIFFEDKPILVRYGWKGNPLVTLRGFISLIDPDFPSDGIPKITLSCMDKTHIMNRKPKKRTWANKKISDVVIEIAKSYGFKTVVTDTGKVLESIEQSDETDIAFIEKQAGDVENGNFITYLKDDTLYFVRRDYNRQPTHSFEYKTGNKQLLSFNPTIDREDQKEESKQQDIDAKSLDVVTNVTNDKTNKDNLGNTKI